VAVLELLSTSTPGARFELRAGAPLAMGRGEAAPMHDPHMSARHFEVVYDAGRCRIRDLGSTNGTFVNGVRISDAALRDGDRIDAGTSAFVVHVQDYGASNTIAPSEPSVGRETLRPTPERRVPGIPVFAIVNDSPFSVKPLRWTDVEGRSRLTIVVKATFAFVDDIHLTPKQLPLFESDLLTESNPPSVRFESDLVPFKPCTDVVLVGRAHAPEGKPVTQMVAGVRVGPVRSGIAVFGDRKWESQLLKAPTISYPQPFLAMDLVYEHAFGGIDASAGLYCKENLVGTGFIGKRTVERIEGLRLPNLEDPRNLIHAWNSRPRPVGLGFYGRGWAPRLAYAGTYDEQYMKTRHPLPPADFSYRFFNGAHPDLQVEGYLRGDEEVDLLNVCPGAPRVHFRLPGIVPKITVSRWTVPPEAWVEEHAGADGSLPAELPLADEALTPVLDTVVFVPDQGVFYQVFRAVCALSSLDSLEVARITVTH
jgi:hypothetical protein